MAHFLASARSLDGGVRGARGARAHGLAERTLVILTTDHGLPFPGAKATLFDRGLGVSLILRGPGRFRGGRVQDAIVSHLDLFPTLCDLAGLQRPEYLQGSSLLPLARGETDRLHDELFAEITYHAAYEPQRAVRTDRYKLIRRFDAAHGPVLPNTDDGPTKDALVAFGWDGWATEEERLHDVLLDPGEGRNLIHDPAYAGVARDLRTRLGRWMEGTGILLLRGPVPLPPRGRANDPRALRPTSRSRSWAPRCRPRPPDRSVAAADRSAHGATVDLERDDQPRHDRGPDQGALGHREQDRALQAGARARRRAHRAQARRARRRGGALRRHRQGLRGLRGRVRRAEKEEVDAAAGERSRCSTSRSSSTPTEIDPVFFDRTYYLGAGDDADDAYRLLHDALERTGRAGIGRWVFHNREYLVAIRSIDAVLAMHTMRFHDELVDPTELDIPAPQRKPTEREIKMAGTARRHAARPTSTPRCSRRPTATTCSTTATKERQGLKAPEPESRERAPPTSLRRPALGRSARGEPEGQPDAPLALVRVPELRARERARAARQRRPRPRPALPPAAREGPHPHRGPALVHEGGNEVPYEEIARLRVRRRGHRRRHRRRARAARADARRARSRSTRSSISATSTRSTSTTRTCSSPPATTTARSRLPAAPGRHGEDRPRRTRALRHAHEGVPGDRPRARRRAVADDDAHARRGAPDEGDRQRVEGQGAQEAARHRARAHRGA